MSTPISQNETHPFVDLGPTLQFPMLPTALGLSTSIIASGTNNSGIVICNGYKNFAFSVTSTQAGTLSIQRYLDTAGNIAQGAALTASITANTAAIINSNDGHPFQALQITVTNSSGSNPATLSNTMLLLQSN